MKKSIKSSHRIPLKINSQITLGLFILLIGVFLVLLSKFFSAYSGESVLQETVLATDPKEVLIQRELHIRPQTEPYRLLLNVIDDNGTSNANLKNDPYWYFATLFQGDNNIVTIGKTPKITSQITSENWIDLGTFNHAKEDYYIFNLRIVPNDQNKSQVNIYSVKFEIRSNSFPSRSIAIAGMLFFMIGFGIVFFEGYKQRQARK